MKTSIMILMVAGGLAMQAAAANPENNPSASTSSTHLGQNPKHPFYEFWSPKTAPSYKVERYGRISSRPWAQTVGWAPPALFVGQRVCGQNLNYYRGGSSPD
jgi:hypothetical protein